MREAARSHLTSTARLCLLTVWSWLSRSNVYALLPSYVPQASIYALIPNLYAFICHYVHHTVPIFMPSYVTNYDQQTTIYAYGSSISEQDHASLICVYPIVT